MVNCDGCGEPESNHSKLDGIDFPGANKFFMLCVTCQEKIGRIIEADAL